MKTNQSIAVLLHVYYIDMLDEIFLYLKNLNHPFDLYVNLTTDYKNGSVEKIKEKYPEAIITISPNKGVDIGGFLYSFKELKKDYDLILKIHTKKSIGTDTRPSDMVRVYGRDVGAQKGREWFINMMDGVLGNEEKVDRILNKFSSDSECGMVGTYHDNYVGRNGQHLKDLCEIFDLDFELYFTPEGERLKDVSFVGGTFFWIRHDILKNYFTEKNIGLALELIPEGYFNEPSHNHAFERVFGLVTNKEQKKLMEIK